MITSRAILDTPLAIVDLETTGFLPGGDKIVEVAVARVEPGSAPALALDTLVNPQRPMAATEIHGISDQDVIGAPTFQEIAGSLLDTLHGAALGAYNIYFDLRFLQTEFKAAGVKFDPPYLCMMYLRPMLGLGQKCTLTTACQAHGIAGDSTHVAGSDVLATARLWQFYTSILAARGVTTFEELAKLKSYKFTKSFVAPPLDASVGATLGRSTRRQPRGTRSAAPSLPTSQLRRQEAGIAEYWDAVTIALSDLELTLQEAESLAKHRERLRLSEAEVRWVHARVFSGLLADACQDRVIQAAEAEALFQVAKGLRTLGWAPGDSLSGGTVERRTGRRAGLWARLFG
ncbi:MAG: PolC-type DNA polymerase III [Gemmatimonadales bacterium]